MNNSQFATHLLASLNLFFYLIFKLRRVITICFIAFVCSIVGTSPYASIFSIEEKEALEVIEKQIDDESTLSCNEIIKTCTSLLSSKGRINRSFIAELYLVRARAYIRKNEFTKASEDLSEVLKIRSSDSNARALLALSLDRSGSNEEAMLQLKKIHTDDSNDYDVYLCKASALYQMNDYQKCIATLNRGLSIHPSAQAYLLRAKALLETGDSAKSLADLDVCISKWPNSATFEAYHLRCRLLRSLNRYDEALENILVSQKLGLDEQTMLLEAWSIYHSLQRYHYSMRIARKLMLLKPENESSLLASAASCNALGDYQKAVGHALAILKNNPNNSDACTELGWAYSGEKKYNESIAQFDKALKICPSSEYALCGKAILLSSCPEKNVRNVDEAHRLAQKACEITNWSKPYCIITLALTKAALDKYEDAASLCQRATRLLPTTVNSRTLQYKEIHDLCKDRTPAVTINLSCPLRFFIHR